MPGEVATAILFDGRPCIDPQDLARKLGEQGYDISDWYGKANSFMLPRGFDSGVGYVLVTYEDLQATWATVEGGQSTLQLCEGTRQITIEWLTILETKAVTDVPDEGPVSPDTVYLVKLADLRHHARLAAVVDFTVNMLTPNRRDYYDASLNGNTPYTWYTLVKRLTDALTPILGPFDISELIQRGGTPENYSFQGYLAWDALREVLGDIGYTVALNHKGDFRIVKLGLYDPDVLSTMDAVRAEAAVKLSKKVTDSHNLVPEQVLVAFPWGFDAFQNSFDRYAVTPKSAWLNNVFHYVPVSIDSVRPGTPAYALTTDVIHSNLHARTDGEGIILNQAQLVAEANRLAIRYYSNRLDNARIHDILHGVWVFEPAETIESVAWYDLGGEDSGMETEIYYGDNQFYEPYRENSRGASRARLHGEYGAPGPPDLTRQHLYPEYVTYVWLEGDLYPGSWALARAMYLDDAGVQDPGGASYVWRLTNKVMHILSGSRSPVQRGGPIPVHWQQQYRAWVAVSQGSGLRRGKALQTLFPGSGAQFVLQVWNPAAGAYIDSDQIVWVDDSNWDNFLCPGEVTWLTPSPRPSPAPNFSSWEPVGSKGLRRRIKPRQDINPYGSGAVNPTFLIDAIYCGVDDPVQATCTGVRHTVNLVVCFWGPRRRLLRGEKLVIWFDVGTKKWYLENTPIDRTAQGVAGNNFDPGAPVAVSGPESMDYDLDVDDETGDIVGPMRELYSGGSATNPHYLEGLANDQLLLKWHDKEGRWELAQVQHHTLQPIVDAETSTCALDFKTKKFQAVTQDKDGDPKSLGFTTVTVAQGPLKYQLGAGTQQDPITACGIYAPLVNLCVLSSASVGFSNPVLFTKISLIDDVYWASNQLRQIDTDVWILCIGASVDELIVAGTTCPVTDNGCP